MMERIGIFGGSFNPPHLGHVQGAVSAAKALNLDRTVMIPASVAPHKELPEGSPTAAQRLDMLRLAAAGHPELEVSDLELRRDGPSYSYQTVEQLRKEHPDAEIFLIMGMDMFLSFHTWKNYEQILQNVTLAVLYREEMKDRAQIGRQKQLLEEKGGSVTLLDNPVLDISSTDLRRMLVFQCAAPFLNEKVLRYIRENHLYYVDRDFRGLPMEDLEKVVCALLNPNRVRHVLGVRDTAERLARRWGADVTDAGRAGLLHDVTKALDGPLQLTLCGEYDTILDEFSSHNPKTLHALTGALVARRIFGENDAVVSAIDAHTTGKANMNTLEKIVYVADYMETNRDFPGVERLRELADTDLDGALQLGLEMTLEQLRQKKSQVSPGTREALEWLTGRPVEDQI